MSGRNCYPRPDFERDLWYGLNGSWKFAFDDADVGRAQHWEKHPERLDRCIEVPFSYQSVLSGIGDPSEHELLWYAREFIVPDTFYAREERIRLCFGAVDWLCDVYVNGSLVCTHEGGYVPFSADITDYLNPQGETQSIVVRVEDSVRCDQPRGKQYWKEKPDRCWYTACSGIWQSVWLEAVPRVFMRSLVMTGNLSDSSVECTLTLSERPKAAGRLEMDISCGGSQVTHCSLQIREVTTTFSIGIREADYVDEIHYWTPEHPNLYDVQAVLHMDGEEDRVRTYFGMRSIQVKDGQVLLNNRPFYQKLLLHQGYYDGGLLTAADDDDYRRDLMLIKEMGFNGIRLHQKIEDPLLYYWADKLGLVVWGELPSCYEFSGVAMERSLRMMQEFIKRDRNHPSVICWVPLNESWGVRNIYDHTQQQNYARALYYLIKSMDPTRLVSTNDGWEQVESDLCCIHDYAADGERMKRKWDDIDSMLASCACANDRMIYADSVRYDGQPVILSEFGGIACKETYADDDWGYAQAEHTPEAFLARLESLMDYIRGNARIQGYCYTQFTDVMQEVNGLAEIDRRMKIPAEKIRSILKKE